MNVTQLSLFDDPRFEGSRSGNPDASAHPAIQESPVPRVIPPMYRLKLSERAKVTDIPPSLQSKNSHPGLFLFRGLVFRQQGFTTLARRDFEQALSGYPPDPIAAWNLAMIHYEENDVKQALHYLLLAHRHLQAGIGRSDPEVRVEAGLVLQVLAFFIATIYARQGDLVRFSQYLLQALGSTPADHAVSLLQVISLYEGQKSEEATALLENRLKQYNPAGAEKMAAMMSVQQHARNLVK